MANIIDEPRGEVYKQLIEYAVNRCYVFTFWLPKGHQPNKKTNEILQKLEPYRWHGDDRYALDKRYTDSMEFYHYRCHKDVIPILQNAADSLYSWKLPQLPEDLCFDLKDGTPWLDLCFHMNIMDINDSDENIKKLYNTIKGLGIVGEFNDSLEMILKDTKERKLNEVWLGEYDLDEVPREIAEMTHLKSLSINQCNILKIPSFISNLVNLECLSLYDMPLDELPKEILQLPNLKQLSINYTNIKIIPKEIDKHSNLRNLDLRKNKIKSIPKEISNLKKLECLFLGDMPLDELPKELFELTNLQELHIYHTNIKTIPKEIDKLINLQSLTLGENNIEHIPKEISNLKNLKVLSIHEKNIKDIPEEIKNMSCYKSINTQLDI